MSTAPDWEAIALHERALRWAAMGYVQRWSEEQGLEDDLMPMLGVEGFLNFPLMSGETVQSRLDAQEAAPPRCAVSPHLTEKGEA